MGPGSHVFVGERAVWVHVHAKGRERRVPVLQRFEEVLALSIEVGDNRFIGDGKPDNNSYLSSFTAEMLRTKNIEPRVNAHRMRATWIASISATASVAAVQLATLTKDFGGFGHLVEAGPGLDERQYAKQLRGCGAVLPASYLRHLVDPQ